MKTTVVMVVAMMGLGGAALAETPPPADAPKPAASLSSLKGQYGFNWLSNPSKEKCVQVTDKVLKDFQKNYTCDLKENTGTSSGKPSVSCMRKDEKKQYLIFKTKAFCDEERETQAANGEG